MVVHSDRQRALGALLTDDVLIERFQNLARLGQLRASRCRFLLELFADDVVTQIDTLIANIDTRAGN
jgi:hypothetical protein